MLSSVQYYFIISFCMLSLFFSSSSQGSKYKESEDKDALEGYLQARDNDRQRRVLVVGCGHICDDDNPNLALIKNSNVQQHRHLGKNFYLDLNAEVQPDIQGDFLKWHEMFPLKDNVRFDSIYFEQMTNYMVGKINDYLNAAHSLLKENGQIFIDGYISGNKKVVGEYRLELDYYDPSVETIKLEGDEQMIRADPVIAFLESRIILENNGFRQIHMGANTFNSRPGEVIIARKSEK